MPSSESEEEEEIMETEEDVQAVPVDDEGGPEEDHEDDEGLVVSAQVENDGDVSMQDAEPDSEASESSNDKEEEDDDEEEEEEEEEEPLKEAAPMPKIRIKLKLPQSSASTTESSPSSAASDTKQSKTSPTSSSLADAPAHTSSGPKDVVSVGGNSKPKPNLPLKLPLKRYSPAGFLKKQNSNANDSVTSVSTGTTGGVKKSRIRSLKLPLSRKAEESPDKDNESTRTTPSGGTYTKRRNLNSTKPVKLPPIISPGLLVQDSSNSNQFTTPSQIFDQAMTVAGYDFDTNVHRGSSVRRTVGDIFDSNVKLTMHFPSLVPPGMFDAAPISDQDEMTDPNNVRTPADQLIEQLQYFVSSSGNDNRQKGLLSMEDMLPVSLTQPLPESYLEARQEYVRAVEDREKAIVAKQENEEEVEFFGAESQNIEIPPIPVPPEPPRGDDVSIKDKSLVAHLDPLAFHKTEGRYAGLFTNNIVDPNFVGPSVLPGSSGGGALATAGSTAATPLVLTSNLFSNISAGVSSGGNAATANSNTGQSRANSVVASTTPAGSARTTPIPMEVDASSDREVAAKAPSDDESTEKKQGPQSSASSTSGLKQIMDEGGPSADAMRQAIIRSAVHASRTEDHAKAFVAPSGQVYPDIGRIFGVYTGIKPCDRCKNNKQGSYFCRLRRRHRDYDYDGGTSFDVLEELLNQSLESLVPTAQATTSTN